MSDRSKEQNASFSDMINYQDQYRRVYESLGHPLTHREGRSETRIRAVERRLGVRLPKALRDYYLVAGTERRFNHIFNHLYAPEECFISGEKLVFMEENQAVVLWGTVAGRTGRRSTRLSGGERLSDRWHLRTMLFRFPFSHAPWQGTFGGAMRCSGTAAASEGTRQRLRSGLVLRWRGEPHAGYNRPGKLSVSSDGKTAGGYLPGLRPLVNSMRSPWNWG